MYCRWLLLLSPLLLILSASATPTSSTSSNVTTFGNVIFSASGNGLFAYDVLNGTTLWTLEEAASDFIPALRADGFMVVSSDETVFGVDSAGRVVWRITEPAEDSQRRRENWGGETFLQPVLGPAGDFAYVCHINKGLHAFSTTNGAIKWVFSKPTLPDRDPPPTAPAVGIDGVVYIADNRVLYALEPENGTQLWTLGFSYAIIGESLTISPLDGSIFVYMDGGYLAAVARNGTLLWQVVPLKMTLNNNYGPAPVVRPWDGVIVVAGDYNVAAVAPNGTVLWSKVGCPTCVHGLDGGAPTLSASGHIFQAGMAATTTSVANLTALDASGNPLWGYTFPSTGARFGGDAVISGNGSTVFFGSGSWLIALDANSGALRWNVSDFHWSTGAICPCPPPMDYTRMLMACWL